MKIFRWQIKQLLKSPNFWSMTFAPLGVGWTAFSIGLLTKFRTDIEPYAWLLWFLIPVGLVVGAIVNWPKRSVTRTLPNMDTEIEVRIGNIFASTSPIVVTIPTTLETEFDSHAIDRNSIQGQFTIRYCGDPSRLSEALTKAANNIEHENEVTNFYSEGVVRRRYSQGEVFICRDFSRVGYLTTFTNFNEHGNAVIHEHEFDDFLLKLWLGIRERGIIGDCPSSGILGQMAA